MTPKKILDVGQDHVPRRPEGQITDLLRSPRSYTKKVSSVTHVPKRTNTTKRSISRVLSRSRRTVINGVISRSSKCLFPFHRTVDRLKVQVTGRWISNTPEWEEER